MTGKLVVLLSLGWVGHAVACSCVNDDALKLYDTSQLIVVARAGALEGDHQRVDVSQVLKGVAPKGGVVLAAQTSTCNAAMQLSAGTEYLLFLTAAPRGLQLTTRCFAPPLVNGAFALRLGEHEVTIHRSMIGEFLNTRGVLPRLELFTSFSVRDGLVETWLAIKNLEDHDVTVFAPSNRDAFAFFVLDANGNVVQPKGYAKVDPKGGELRIAAKSPYNHRIEPSSNLYFPFLSGTAQFGYALEHGQRYRVHLLYRPFGTSYGAVSSAELEVTP